MRMGSFSVVDDRDLEMAGGKNSVSGTCGEPEFSNSDEDLLRPVSCSQSFSIREYVSMVRSSDIRKNWPFSQKYLQVCLDNGRKPVLPPFEHPQSVRDLIQEKVKLEAAAIHGGDFDSNEVITCGDIGAKDTGNRFLIRIPAKRTHTGQKNNRKLGREKPVQSVSVSSGDQEDVMTRACREAGSQVRNGCEGIKTKTEEDEELRAQEAEDGEMPKAVAGTSEEEDNQGSKPIAGTGDRELGTPCKTEHKDKGSETKTPESVEQESGHKLPNSGLSSKPNSEISSKPNSEIPVKARRKRTERPEILSDIKNRFLKRSKQSNRMLTFEMKSLELTDRFQKEGKKQEHHHHEQSKTDSARNENMVNSGSSVTDGIMMVKVCPVCKTFSSTSNTTLNAHIDHCLAAEPNAEKTEIKLAKNKTKVRKKRSMADICAVAPSRTLEDLIYATAQKLDPLQLDVSKWNGTSIRRGHRTPLSRVAKRHFDYADPNPKKLRNSSVLKTDCLPHLPKESHKEPSISGDRGDKGSYCTRRSRRSAFRNMTRTGKSLSSPGLDKCHDKVPRAYAVKHILNEGISQRKSQHALEEIIREEKLPSSVYSTSWAFFNKQGGSKRKKFKHKLVSLKLAGIGQRSSDPGNVEPRNVLEPKSQNHLEGSKLSEGNPMGSKESAGAFVLQPSDKGHYLPSDVSSKRNKAKHSRKVVENNSNSSGELEEFFTSKRMKNLSSLNFQNTVTKVLSSVGETNSPNSVKPQVEQEVNCQTSKEERRHSSHDSAKVSVSDTFNSHKSERIAVSKTLQHETGPSVRETQSSMSSQLKRAQYKEHFKESKKALNLKTLKRPNPFNPAAGSSLKKTGVEHTNVQQKRSRNLKCSFGSPKMKRVSHIVYGLMNMKDVAKTDSELKVHDTESKRESQELIYDAGSTSNQSYSIKVRDSLSNKEKTICAMESSSIDKQHRSDVDLQSGAFSSGELSAKPLETSGNFSHEIAVETQAQLDSTVTPIYEVSREPSQDGAFVTDENLQNCMFSYTIPEKIGAASCLLEVCNNRPSYQQLGLNQAMCNDITGNLSPNKGKDSSGSCVSFQSQLNSCSVEELENLYFDDCLGKRDGFPRNLDGQFLCMRNEMQDNLSPVSLGNQTLNHDLLTQSDSFYQKSTDVDTAILKPSCMSVRNTSSDSTSYIETKLTNISSPVNKSFDKLSSQLLKPLQESTISNETTMLISDSIDVAPVSKGSNFAYKSQLSCELTSEKLGITRPGLTSIDEVSPAVPQSFENFARPAFDSFVQTPPSIITSTGHPLVSRATLFQGSSTLLEDSKSVAPSNVLPAVPMPQFVSDSLLFAKSGDISTATDVLHGSILNTSSSTHPGVFNGILSSSNSTSSRVSEEQYGLKHNLSSPLFRVMDGENGSYSGINACGFSSQVSNIPSHVSTLLSQETGAQSGSKLLPKTYGSQLSESNAVSSLNTDMVTEQADNPETFSSFGNAHYSREPSIVHIFGNPILRLMGKNVILSSKDGTQSRKVEDVCTDSGDSLPNQNYLTSLESRSESNSGKDGHGHGLLFQVLERPQASDPDMLQCFEDRTGKDSNFLQPFEAKGRDMVDFSLANTYREESPTDMGNISQVYSWNLTASPCQPLNVTNGVQHPWLSTKMPSSCISPDSMSNGVSHATANVSQHMKWQSPDSSLPHSDPEIIVIDDNIDTEATSIEASFVPTFLQGRTCQLQDSIMMSNHLKSNSKVRSRLASSESLNNRNHFSNESTRTFTYGSNVLKTKEIPSEPQRIEINFPGFQ